MTKEIFKSNIIMKMRHHLDSTNITILENVLNEELQKANFSNSQNELSTFDDTNKYMIDLFITRKCIKLSQKTSTYYLDTLRRFIDYTNKPLTKVDDFDVDSFLNHLMKEGNSEVSVNNHRRNLSAIFTWFRKQRLVIYNPCDAIEPYKEIKKPIEHLTSDEQDQLYSGCKYKRDRALLEFLRCTAVRGGEIKNIRVCDIDWENNKIQLFGEKSRTYRVVYIDNTAKRYIKEYVLSRNILLDSNDNLFVHLYDNNPLSEDGILHSIKMIAKRSHFDSKNVYTHIFRKSVATRIVNRGGSIADVGKYLGHKDKNTTAKYYAYVDDNYIRGIFDKYVASV